MKLQTHPQEGQGESRTRPTPLKKNLLGSVWGCVRLLRLPHWIKNGFVFAPLVFNREFLDPAALARTGLAALCFGLAASAVYVLNDVQDAARDAQHPRKRRRPIPAGNVTVGQAYLLFTVLATLALGGGFLWQLELGLVLTAYMVLNLAYSAFLKHEPVLDIFCIAAGFVLRVYAGAVVLSIALSHWMFITTLSLSLYLAAIKRHSELLNGGGEHTRRALRGYTPALADRYAQIAAAATLVFYSLFVFSARPALTITIPVVIFGLFRYWYLAENKSSGENPEKSVLTDLQLFLTVIVWSAICLWVLWPTS